MTTLCSPVRLIEVGHSFCGSASDTLQESLKKQCWSYFQSYHLARLEELQMHLENEGWALCPVRSTFRAQHLVVSSPQKKKKPIKGRSSATNIVNHFLLQT